MKPTRRDFLAGAAGAAAGVGATSAAIAGKALLEHDRAHSEGHSEVPSDFALRVKAFESLLVEKGIISRGEIDIMLDKIEHSVGPHLGTRIVTRAWLDPKYRQQLIEDASAAVHDLDDEGHHVRLRAVQNSPTVHNLVVCSLCSCYPIGLLGLPPAWYRSDAYRARAVLDPRGLLAEFGLHLGEDVEIRVWDSTAHMRYLVVPERPAGTEGFGEDQLAALVTRDAMVGVAKATAKG